MPIGTVALEKAIPVTHLGIENQPSGCDENYGMIVLVSEASLASRI